MNELLKRAISGLFIIIWIFSTLLYSTQLFVFSMVMCLIIILFLEWPKLAPHYHYLFFIYPLISFLLIIYLQLFGYAALNMYAFAACFLFDSSAYVFGKLLGKHKVAPKISPGKTIEGCLGGCLTLLVSYFMYLEFRTNTTLISLFGDAKNFLIPTIISFLAFCGDLFESYLKRKSDLKDIGSLLPGHGGLLDRFDSILFVIPFVFLLRHYLITIFHY